MSVVCEIGGEERAFDLPACADRSEWRVLKGRQDLTIIMEPDDEQHVAQYLRDGWRDHIYGVNVAVCPDGSWRVDLVTTDPSLPSVGSTVPDATTTVPERGDVADLLGAYVAAIDAYADADIAAPVFIRMLRGLR